MKVISRNKKAKRDYQILDTFQAGISLLGSEIKSIRAGDVSMDSSFINLIGNQAFLKNVNIKEYHFSRNNHDPLRDRPLLLNKSELRKIRKAKEEKGNSIVALSIGINKKGFAKVDMNTIWTSINLNIAWVFSSWNSIVWSTKSIKAPKPNEVNQITHCLSCVLTLMSSFATKYIAEKANIKSILNPIKVPNVIII